MALTHQMHRATILLIKKNTNLRLAIICIAAASVGLAMAIVSIAKLLLPTQLGIPGILLFLASLLSILRDTLGMETSHARAAQSVMSQHEQAT